MEDRMLVVKALLESYPFIEDMKRALAVQSEQLASSGFYAIFPNEQMRIYEKLIRNGMRKGVLDRMKRWIDFAFFEGDSPALSLLKERYIHGAPMSEVMNKYGVSLRTCYRYVKRGLAALTSLLEKHGVDKRRILTECGDESLFSMMLNKVIEEDDEEKSLSDRQDGRVEKGHGQSINNRHSNRLHHGSNGGHRYYA